jgi:hypothetical protein
MSSDIQALIDRAAPGGTLLLEPARREFRGPVIVRRPLTVVGQGGTLWAPKGPVLTVLSKGVVLQDLNVEVTQDQLVLTDDDACALVVGPGLGVTLNSVVVRGDVRGLDAEEGRWRYPRSLRLGALRAGREHRFIMRLTAPAPCRLESEIAGLEVRPREFPGGPAEIEIAIEPLKAETRLNGHLKLCTGRLTRLMKVTGHFQEEAGRDGPMPSSLPSWILRVTDHLQVEARRDAVGVGQRPNVPSSESALGPVPPPSRTRLANSGEAGPGKPPSYLRTSRWVWGSLIAVVMCLLLTIGLLARGCSGSGSNTDKEKQAEVKNPEPPRGPVISPSEARQWEGKEVTIRVVVKSTSDRFDWAFMINSEEDFRHPENFTVIVEKESAGAKYKAKGISGLSEYFKKNTVLLVTGKVEKYKDKRSGKEQYQIRVKDPEQIQRL